MKLMDKHSNRVVAQEVRIAKNFLARMRGLLGTDRIGQDTAFLIPKCQGVHTYGMRYAIDVIYLDHSNKILEIREALDPNQRGPVIWSARAVIEMEAGTATRQGLQVGQTLIVK